MSMFNGYSKNYDPNIDETCENCTNSYSGEVQNYHTPCSFCDENPEKIECDKTIDGFEYLFEMIKELEEKIKKLENK